MLLENNGVKSAVFLKYQRNAMKITSDGLRSADGFLKMLERYSLGSSYALIKLLRLFSMHKIANFDDLQPDREALPGFIRRLAQLTRVHLLRELKHHARIPVPGAYSLLGVADEWE